MPRLTWRLTTPASSAEATSSAPSAPERHEENEEHFVCSSDPARIQPDALRDALASDLLWWASAPEPAFLAAMVANSVCLGLYRMAPDTKTDEPQPGEQMVGFARIITDRVSFAYLTDVYVLPAYQRRGLGAWMTRCLRDLLQRSPGWPYLRSLWLMASTPAAARMYIAALGGEAVARYRPTPGVSESGMILVEMAGPANGVKSRALETGEKQLPGS